MTIHQIYQRIFKIWRVKRMRWFEETLQPNEKERLLDVGGYPGTWIQRPQRVKQIDCLNIHPVVFSGEDHPSHRIETVVGNGCDLAYEDKSYDILFSNSVIEHVGDWEAQKKFAAETRRVGQKLWIQTPAFECPMEPHFLAPFVHWLPVKLRKFVVRWMTPWGWLTKPDVAKVERTVAFTRLLTRKQMQMLYPDCAIITERLFFLLPKSYVAYRLEPPNQP